MKLSVEQAREQRRRGPLAKSFQARKQAVRQRDGCRNEGSAGKGGPQGFAAEAADA
jgi:hypothetical protein